jgi:DNA-binding MarR family transcriptional regulator
VNRHESGRGSADLAGRTERRATEDGAAKAGPATGYAAENGAAENGAADPGADFAEVTASQVALTVMRLFRSLERADAGLTPQQYRILKLAGAGGERSARLAERLAVAKPTLTATADGLVAAGYARRDAEPGDRRVVRLCLTPAGREAVDRADLVYSRWLARLLGGISAADRILILHSLSVLDTTMDELRCARPAGSAGSAGSAEPSDPAPTQAQLRKPAALAAE